MAETLKPRHKHFAREYVANGGNGTQAAIAAGYSATGAHVRASEFVKDSKISDEIDKVAEETFKAANITADWIAGKFMETFKEAEAPRDKNNILANMAKLQALMTEKREQTGPQSIADMLKQIRELIDEEAAYKAARKLGLSDNQTQAMLAA